TRAPLSCAPRSRASPRQTQQTSRGSSSRLALPRRTLLGAAELSRTSLHRSSALPRRPLPRDRARLLHLLLSALSLSRFSSEQSARQPHHHRAVVLAHGRV